jgi:hypothetical protein
VLGATGDVETGRRLRSRDDKPAVRRLHGAAGVLLRPSGWWRALMIRPRSLSPGKPYAIRADYKLAKSRACALRDATA